MPITNSDDIIDSRDVIERIAELESQLEQGDEDREDLNEELSILTKLTEEAEGYCPDWRYGATLIRESYFQAYAQELADDIGAIDSNAGWPVRHIDWAAAARELKQDYTEVEFDGQTYYVR